SGPCEKPWGYSDRRGGEAAGQGETMVVRYSRRKAMIAVVLSILVAGGAGVALSRPLETSDRVAAAGIAAVAGVAAVQAFRRTRRGGPVLVISEDGFHDHRLKIGPIPWTEVADVTAMGIRGQSFVSLHLRHPEVYLQGFSEIAKTLGKLESAAGL